ncbi:quinone oxidoreductase family protein [Pseudomonas putida]
MKAIRIERFGGPEVMQLRDVEVPEPKTGEVLVKNFFVGINPVDYKIRQGQYPEVKQDKLPLTLGREVAGVVEKVGQGVSDFKPGDRVFAMIGADGGYAEYARVPAAHLARIPAALDWPVAAGRGIGLSGQRACARQGCPARERLRRLHERSVEAT